MKVIYIAGTSHSGSTLLDLMLNAHPQIVSVGEMVNLNRQLTYKNSKEEDLPTMLVRGAFAMGLRILVRRQPKNAAGGRQVAA